MIKKSVKDNSHEVGRWCEKVVFGYRTMRANVSVANQLFLRMVRKEGGCWRGGRVPENLGFTGGAKRCSCYKGKIVPHISASLAELENSGDD